MENRKKSINVLPVVENGEKEIVGILRLHDIIQSGLNDKRIIYKFYLASRYLF